VEPPFVGPSYNLDSRPASVQRTVNLIPVPQEPGNERTSWVFKDAPGLVLLTDFPVQGSDWLGYNDEDLGPNMMGNSGVYHAISTPVAFADGVTFNNLSLGNSGSVVEIPLSGGTATVPTLVENENWFPFNPGGAAPTFGTSDPTSGVWSGFTWIMTATQRGYVTLPGPSGTTTITILIQDGGFYEGATLEYAA
jgi:hypothetical protein